MNVESLSRLQFAMTAAFHFLFPPITIGLSWLLVILETSAWRSGRSSDETAAKLFARLLGLTFAVGVATGIVMEFQFGTNWSRYSRFVGDIFGAPLAAEGVLAFFLESGFLGLYLFGRNRVSRRLHVFSIVMVALGSTLSAFWIIVANSWMQTPAGYAIDPATGRAVLTSFKQAVFNPSTIIRYHHVVDAALVTGAFFMAGCSAWLLRRNPNLGFARQSLKVALVFGLIVSVLEAFPFGHAHAKQVAHTQPEKFAAIEGLYSSQSGAPLVMFALPFTKPPTLKAKVEVPGMLSWLAFGDVKAEIPGLDKFPEHTHPPLWLTFVSFHNMVVLGLYFIAVTALGTWMLWRGTLWNSRRFLTVLVWSAPLPLIANQLGWIAAEVGRQPWIVYHLMKTSDAFSPVVSGPQIVFSLILFFLLYTGLAGVYLFLLSKKLHHAAEQEHVPQPLPAPATVTA